MIEAIKEIGKIRLGKMDEVKGSEILESLVDDPPNPKKEGTKLHIVILNYDTFDRKVEVDFEEIKEDETPGKYLWMGTLPGNEGQIYSTTTNLGYLLSQVIPNLKERLPKESSLSKGMNRVVNSLFYDLRLKGRYRFVLDIERLGLAETGYTEGLKKRVEDLKEKGAKDSDISGEVIKEVVLKVDEFISKKTLLKKKDIGLYTLKIDGKLIAQDEDYKNIVAREKIDSLFGEKKGVCSSCNQFKPITDRPEFARARSALGYYITDKVGFSSELSGDFTKSLTLCKDCYKGLLTGEVFIRNKLSSNIGGLNLYVIPRFIFSSGRPGQNQLEKWADYIRDSFNSAKSLTGLRKFEENLEGYKEFEDTKNSFIINILFFKSEKRGIKILRLIKDVPPTRLENLIRTANKIKDIGDRVLSESNQWYIDLQTIYFLIPLRSGKEIEHRKILELYDAIFSGKPVSYRFLIQQFVELAQVYRFKKVKVYNVTYNIKKPEDLKEEEWDRRFRESILRANLTLLYLKELRILKGGEGIMDYDSLDVDEGMREFVREMGYDEPKVAMFLLGCLIGKIGNAQYSPESSSKPILNKITYQGMNRNKLIRLLNEVFEKLTQYKSGGKPLLYYNEGLFAECKRLMDKNIGEPLSDQENVFYVLSGYAYATHQAIIMASQPKEAKPEEEVKANG